MMNTCVSAVPRSPKIAYIRILEACNAKCKMCRFAGSTDIYRLPLEKLKQLAAELAELDTEEIRFTGGEPTLYEDLMEAIRFIRSLGLRVSTITNGSRLKHYAAELVDAGITGIVCSLDSPRAEIHNTLRGTPRLFEDAVEGLAEINRLRDREKGGLKLVVNSIVSNRTYDHLDEFIPLLDEIGVDLWRLNPIKDVKGMYLTPDEIRQYNVVAARIQDRLQTSRVRLNAVNPFIFGTSEEEIEGCSKGKALTYSKCFVPLYVSYIDAKNGSMTACQCLPHRKGKPLSVEGVFERPFKDIWNESQFASNRQSFSQVAPQVCTGCEPANVKWNKDYHERQLEAADYSFSWDS
ncbi:radical SAM protein [Paenibacillus oleatilyticus]|uniref:radical SAM protein n=1 Tax=Paenibacillus oleatilyticus TaxID=2594886 RepID=UPI001C1FCEAF|nr:radical SAM protein [Paenibacillus oleatilyticus]MBU7315048.1 radical SAM protein [Paenibacillus oleatilyticus]